MITDTIIINLKKRVEKREFALQQATKYKLPRPQVLVATTPRSSRLNEKTGSTLSLSEKACCLSHVRIWKHFANLKSKDWILILEDDAYGMVDVETMHHILIECTQKVPACIDVINIGGRKRATPLHLVLAGDSFNVYQYDECLYHAYVIRKKACERWSHIAFTSPKALDKVHQVHSLKGRYSVVEYVGDVKPEMDIPENITSVKLGRGVFSQIRGNATFESDLSCERKKNKHHLKR
jgi:hypothetical protein